MTGYFRVFLTHFPVVDQSLSCAWLFVTPWTAARQASLSFIISWSLLKFMSIESVMPSNHLVLCHPLLLLPSIFPSIRVFIMNEGVDGWDGLGHREPLLLSHQVMSDSLQLHEIAARQASLSFTVCWNWLRLMSVESMMPSNYLILCHPLLLLSSMFPSVRVFSSESALCIRWPKYWSFSFSISPSNEHSGLISFRIDWFRFLVVQGTLKSLLHTTVRKHQFFDAQPSLWSNSHICTWLLVKS